MSDPLGGGRNPIVKDLGVGRALFFESSTKNPEAQILHVDDFTVGNFCHKAVEVDPFLTTGQLFLSGE